jgi:hypothetical protein
MTMKVGKKIKTTRGDTWTITKADYPRPGQHQVIDQSGQRFDVSEHTIRSLRTTFFSRIFGRKK